METLVGIATSVSHSISIAGACGAVQRHTTNFRIDGRHSVRIDAYDRALIDDGDLVAVAGSRGAKHLQALAYENLSSLTSGSAGTLGRLIEGLALLCMAAFTDGTLTALCLAAYAAWCLLTSARIALAERALAKVTASAALQATAIAMRAFR